MELKLLANTELRKKFHYIRRLRKAASHANQLEELCYAEACDARTKLEAQVYSSMPLLHGCKRGIEYHACCCMDVSQVISPLSESLKGMNVVFLILLLWLQLVKI